MIRYFTRVGAWRIGLIAIALSLSLLVYTVSVGSEPSPTVTAEELIARIEADESPLILDVRSPTEFAEGHIPGAINIPYRQLPEGLEGVSIQPGQDIVVYCERGIRAAIAKNTLKAEGIGPVLHLSGDMVSWRKAGLPVEMPVYRPNYSN